MILFTAFVVACAPPPSPPPELPAPPKPEASPVEVPAPPPPPPCLAIARIEVWKGERTLQAFCKRGAVVAMNVALGRDEVGHKFRAGDHRTPEGSYRISGAARESRFYRFIPIDYPSEEDAKQGLASGRISTADYQRIRRAHERGETPPDDTAIGGNLGFHGEGKRWRGDSQDLDWTYGCIAMTDDEIDWITERVEPGVPVWIHP